VGFGGKEEEMMSKKVESELAISRSIGKEGALVETQLMD
jgi:hypothetical protein